MTRDSLLDGCLLVQAGGACRAMASPWEGHQTCHLVLNGMRTLRIVAHHMFVDKLRQFEMCSNLYVMMHLATVLVSIYGRCQEMLSHLKRLKLWLKHHSGTSFFQDQKHKPFIQIWFFSRSKMLTSTMQCSTTLGLFDLMYIQYNIYDMKRLKPFTQSCFFSRKKRMALAILLIQYIQYNIHNIYKR